MTTYSYESIAVYSELGGSVRIAGNVRAFVTDPTTGLPVNATQGAVVAPYVDADATGNVSFTAESWPVRLTSGTTYEDVWPVDAAGPADATVAGLIGTATATRSALDDRYVTDAEVAAGYAPLLVAGKGVVRKDSLVVNVKDYGAVGDGVTNDTAAIQAALDAAASTGARVFASGTFLIASTITIKSAVDMGDAALLFTGTGVAIQVGDPASTLWRVTIVLPDVIASAKTVVGWTEVAGTVGVRLTNLYSCFVTIPRVNKFETGLQMHGQYPNGTSWNTLYLGQLDNNKVNLAFAPQDSGSAATSSWANQNTFLGGRLSHNSDEPTPGTRHISIPTSSNSINNNVFYGTSLESPDVVEYHIEIAGWYNYFNHCRWENTTPANRRIHWVTPAKGNVIHGGIYAGDLIVVADSGTSANEIVSDTTGVKGAWTAYVPEWTSSGTAPVLGNGTLTGRYLREGKTILGYEIRLTAGTTTTYGTGNYAFSLPVAHQNGNVDALGYAYASIAGVLYAGVATKTGTTAVQVLIGSTRLTNALPGVMASGNTVSISGTYEGA